MKAVARFLFYFFLSTILFICLAFVLVGGLYGLNIAIKELTGIDAVKEIVKRCQKKS